MDLNVSKSDGTFSIFRSRILPDEIEWMKLARGGGTELAVKQLNGTTDSFTVIKDIATIDSLIR